MMNCLRCNEKAWKDGHRDGVQRYKCSKCGYQFDESNSVIEDMEVVEESVKLAKRAQKFQDINRVERKTFREHARVENALGALNTELISLLENEGMRIQTNNHDEYDDSCILISHISDTHFNEMVNLQNNKYDFEIASKRIKKKALFIKNLKSAFNISHVVVAITGDLLNSDRRLDEVMTNAGNRASACFVAVNLMESYLLDLNEDFNVSVCCVTGNESRIQDEIGYSDHVVSDNYDLTIFNCLKYIFKDKKGVVFHDLDPWEDVITVNGVNILLLHGLTKGDTQGYIQQLIGKWASKGRIIDYVIFGHIHFANITDAYARSGSLVGNNVYSDRAIGLITKASQNIHLIMNNKDINSIKVDLQNTDNIEGYEIDTSLNMYNVKSHKKLFSPKTVVKVVI